MFSIFAKKEMNRSAAAAFWAWFAAGEETIIRQIQTHDSDFVWDIDTRLRPVFPYFHRELAFQLTYDRGEGEFIFFAGGHPRLAGDAAELASLMPRDRLPRWRFVVKN